MKQKLLLVYCCLLFTCMGQVYCQTGKTGLSQEQLLADFDVLRDALKEAHGGLYRFSSKTDIDNLFSDTRKRIGPATSRQQFIAILSEMLAALRDGHMRLDYDEATVAALNKARTFPLGVLIEKNRLMVLYNDSPGDTTIRPGMEILSINGEKSNDILGKLLPKMRCDGFVETGKIRRIERGFANNYWMFIGQNEQFDIAARDAKGKTINATLTGVLSSERENNRKNNPVNKTIRTSIEKLDGAPGNISLRFIDETAYLKIRGFEGSQFTTQLDSVFLLLRNKNTKALILDLRGNGGGVDHFGAYLVAQFMDKPFRYFDRIHLTTINPSFTKFTDATYENLKNGVTNDPKGGFLVSEKLHTGVGEQSPGKNPFTGKTFVLTDGITFSTAADVTALLKNANKAIFIGEETGGTYEGNTSGLNAQVNLPNTGFRVRIHMYEYWNAVAATNKGRGTRPDQVVEKKIADLLQQIDLPLQRALELARQ